MVSGAPCSDDVRFYFRPEVEIWQHRACAIKNMQYNPYLMVVSTNFYRNHLVIVDLAIEQILRSTEPISSCH